MRLIALFLFLLLPPSYAGQVFSSLEAVENKNTMLISNAAGSDEKIIKTVTASGYGTSIDAAAQNAAENALTQVVGSFIDAETQIKKQKEIRDGVISKTKVIKKDIRDYSQGSIKYFEVLNVQQNGSIYNVSARVDVRVDDFRAYIKELAYGSQKVEEGLFTQIATNLNTSNKKLDILRDKVITPIKKGEVIEIEIGKPQPYEDFIATNYCSRDQIRKNYVNKFGNSYLDETSWGQSIFCSNITSSYYNKQKVIVMPVAFTIKKDFKKNIINIMNNISDDKSVNRSGFRISTQIDDYIIRFNDFEYGRAVNSTDYLLKNISREAKERSKKNTLKRIPYNSFNINLIDENDQKLLIQNYPQIGGQSQIYFYGSNGDNKIHLYTVDNKTVYKSRFAPLLNGDENYYKYEFTNRGVKDHSLLEFQRYFMLVLDVDVDILSRIKKVEIEFI